MSNTLRDMLIQYPDAWIDPKRFKALLMDYMPQDKLCRNLLLISVEEQIPHDLKEKEEIDNRQISLFKKKLCNACGCEEGKADEIIMLWVNSLGIKVVESTIISSGTELTEPDQKLLGELDEYCDKLMTSVDDLGFSERTARILKNGGIITLEDLAKKSEDDLSKLRKVGSKSLYEIHQILAKYGVGSNDHKDDTIVDKASGRGRISINSLAMRLNKGDYSGVLKTLEKAVDEGFGGDYSIIGILYANGRNGVRKDVDNALKWLNRFYDDFKNGKIVAKGNACMFSTCYYLGYCMLYKAQSLDHPDKDAIIDKTVSLWREAVTYAPDLIGYGKEDYDEDEEDDLITDEIVPDKALVSTEKKIETWKAWEGLETIHVDGLLMMGNSFHNGIIHSDDFGDVEIRQDYECAFNALKNAEMLASNEARTILADMYEHGNFVQEDPIKAASKYLISAFNGELKAQEWCQKHLIDDLPWEGSSNWETCIISDKWPNYRKVADYFGIRSVDDFRRMRVSTLKCDDVFMRAQFFALCVDMKSFTYRETANFRHLMSCERGRA